MRIHNKAANPADSIGPEVISASIEALSALAAQVGGLEPGSK